MPPDQQQLPIIVDGIHGQPPINFYPAADSELGVLLQPTPGKKSICTLPSISEVRGGHTFLPWMYWVGRRGSESVVFRVGADGSNSEIGTITTSFTGPVWMEHSTSQLLIGDGTSGYVYTPATNLFSQITDPAFPGASTCSAQDGYGLFTQGNSRIWFISILYDFGVFDANQFYVKEGKPDNVVCVKSLLREPWIMGAESIEVWTNVGGSGTQPTFQRLQGGLIEYGLGAAASAQILNSKMVWVSEKKQLLQAIAYQPQKISSQMMERAVGGFPLFSDAVAFCYTDQKHDFYVVSFKAGDQTWVWDDTTQMLHRRQSFNDAGDWGRDRANCYCFYSNKHYVGDYSNGKIYEMSSSYYDDDGEEIRREFYMTPIDGKNKLITFPDVEIGVKSGVGLTGTGAGSDPQIMLDFSSDQGETWSNGVWQSAGKIGEYGRKARWTDMGSGYWRMYRAVMTDPVLWQIQSVTHGAL